MGGGRGWRGGGGIDPALTHTPTPTRTAFVPAPHLPSSLISPLQLSFPPTSNSCGYAFALAHRSSPRQGKPVLSAIMRVFGPQVAELPLIATRQSARRQGHARVVLDRLEELLVQAGVHRLVLPAAHETIDTWKGGFGFVDVPEAMVR
jgi:hypothetical protein